MKLAKLWNITGTRGLDIELFGEKAELEAHLHGLGYRRLNFSYLRFIRYVS